jgi:hypothetical protein
MYPPRRTPADAVPNRESRTWAHSFRTPGLRVGRDTARASGAGEATGQKEEALALAGEAGAVAEASAAAGVLRSVERLRRELQ